ncbi:hypothetical protein ACFSCX_20340 [Bacillus salitolerans]|uniref:DUF402 domain-containing protein n=1 Tax=Bacillus salitolerans TaxID=1437434 RepID=A0ABW4LWF6_9BACI
MDQIRIKVNNKSLYINNSNNIVGEIYIEKNGYIFFPKEKWTDFVVVILSWWNEKLRYFKYGNIGERIEFDFMEGSLLLRLEKLNHHEVNIKGIKRNLINEEVLFEAETLFNDLKKSLVTVSNSVIGHAKLKGWETNELAELKNQAKSLLH